MTKRSGALEGARARGRVARADRATLRMIVGRHVACDATGEPLDPASAVAMTVTVAPGVSRVAVVTAAHWDGGRGALSSADPAVHPDVLDGRRLFGRDPQVTLDGPVSQAALAAAGPGLLVESPPQLTPAPHLAGRVPRA